MCLIVETGTAQMAAGVFDLHNGRLLNVAVLGRANVPQSGCTLAPPTLASLLLTSCW